MMVFRLRQSRVTVGENVDDACSAEESFPRQNVGGKMNHGYYILYTQSVKPPKESISGTPTGKRTGAEDAIDATDLPRRPVAHGKLVLKCTAFLLLLQQPKP